MTKEERALKALHERVNYALRDKTKKRLAVAKWQRENRQKVLESKRKYYYKMRLALNLYRKEVENA